MSPATDREKQDPRTRILYIIARMNVGGPAGQVIALTEGLDPSSFNTRVLVGSVGGGEADYLRLRSVGMNATTVPGLGRDIDPIGDLRAFTRILREIREFRPHIVHTHTAKAGVLGRLAARLLGVPHTVHTYHGHLLRGYYSPAVTAGVRAIERRLARRTSRLITVGSRVRDELLEAGIGQRDQYVAIPPGVDAPADVSRAEARRALGLSEDALVVSFVGRLTSIKRPDRLIDVAQRVLEVREDAVFLIVGGGPELASTKERAASLGRAVRFLGWRADVENVYASSDIVLLTSDNEGMPVTLIEAAYCGVPVVTTNVGSASEVVCHGETGLVTSTDVMRLSEAVLMLAEEPERRARMGSASRVLASESFTLGRLVADTAHLYRTLTSIEIQGRR